MGYLYTLNFEGVIYKKTGMGCSCCGRNGDLFGFISSKTGLPRDAFYLEIGSEKIRDEDFSVKKYRFEEYFFKCDPNKTIRTKYEDKQFLIYLPKEIDYGLLYESIAKVYCSSVLGLPANDKRVERMKIKLNNTCDLDLIFNDDDDEDSWEIKNLKEIIVVKMESDEDKKE